MEEDVKLKLVYYEAYNYLRNKVGDKTLRQNVNYYEEYKPDSLNDIFEQMLESLKIGKDSIILSHPSLK